MWWITNFEPVTMFSLKAAAATSTGGKSLLLPTPFSFKMALLKHGDPAGRDRCGDTAVACHP